MGIKVKRGLRMQNVHTQIAFTKNKPTINYANLEKRISI